jgi:hypothetical protein
MRRAKLGCVAARSRSCGQRRGTSEATCSFVRAEAIASALPQSCAARRSLAVSLARLCFTRRLNVSTITNGMKIGAMGATIGATRRRSTGAPTMTAMSAQATRRAWRSRRRS